MGAETGPAQNDQDVVADQELKELQLEQKKAQARQAIAEARKATLLAQLPTSETKPLEGKVDVGAGVGLVSQLLAYKLLGFAAAAVAKVVRESVEHEGAGGARLLIVEDRSLVANDWPYEMIRRQLDGHAAMLKLAVQQLETAVGPLEPRADRETTTLRKSVGALAGGGVALATVLTAMVGAVAGLAGMFRTDYVISSRDVNMGRTPLVAAVAQRLLEAGAPPIEVDVDQFRLLKDSRIIKSFWDARKDRMELELLNTKLKERLLSHEKPPEGASATSGLAAYADAVMTQFDGFTTGAATATKEGAYAPLVAAALHERLHGDPECEGSVRANPTLTHVLYVGIEGQGGETVTRKSLFGRSDVVDYMGGGEVSYLLLDVRENKLVAAGNKTLLGHLTYDLKEGTVRSWRLNEWPADAEGPPGSVWA